MWLTHKLSVTEWPSSRQTSQRTRNWTQPRNIKRNYQTWWCHWMHLKHWGHNSCVGSRKHLLQLLYCIYMITGSLSVLLYCFSRADGCFSKIWNICCDCKSYDSFVLRWWKKKHKHKLRQQLADVLWQLSGGSAKNICFFKEGIFSPVKTFNPFTSHFVYLWL